MVLCSKENQMLNLLSADDALWLFPLESVLVEGNFK
jgi:hypothetical protein